MPDWAGKAATHSTSKHRTVALPLPCTSDSKEIEEVKLAACYPNGSCLKCMTMTHGISNVRESVKVPDEASDSESRQHTWVQFGHITGQSS